MTQPQVPWLLAQYQWYLWVWLGGTGIDRHQLLQSLLRIHRGVPGAEFTWYHSIQGSRTTVQKPTSTQVNPMKATISRVFMRIWCFQQLSSFLSKESILDLFLVCSTKLLQSNIWMKLCQSLSLGKVQGQTWATFFGLSTMWSSGLVSMNVDHLSKILSTKRHSKTSSVRISVLKFCVTFFLLSIVSLAKEYHMASPNICIGKNQFDVRGHRLGALTFGWRWSNLSFHYSIDWLWRSTWMLIRRDIGRSAKFGKSDSEDQSPVKLRRAKPKKAVAPS